MFDSKLTRSVQSVNSLCSNLASIGSAQLCTALADKGLREMTLGTRAIISGGGMGEKCFVIALDPPAVLVATLEMQGRRSSWHEEVKHSTHARMVVSGVNAVYIVGTFKHLGTDADFKVNFNMGYTMTGTLERGNKSTNTFQMTHFAVLRRCDHESHHLKNA
ncbi:unnamed protein product [Leptidea sinapis]|uniref:Uncharacterized protein n=1 Tax=Leptidea sinapis TaxID=189913 RepID=A0A5E4QVD9_9NEOP|nr:unnamed protein product [Leptidea sinapis]